MSLTLQNQLTPIPVTRQDFLQKDSSFNSDLRSKAEAWLDIPVESGHEMDSVNFGIDRFELMVDTRGYSPENLKCNVGPFTIEILAESSESSGSASRVMATTRCYNLPRAILPDQTLCCLSAEGILLIAAPWQK